MDIDWNMASTIANLVVVPVTGGKVEFYNGSDGVIDLIADLQGEFNTGGDTLYQPITQTRAIDATVGTDSHLQVNLPMIPFERVETVVITVTVTDPKDAGYLTISPDTSNHGSSHMHWAAGQTPSETVFAWSGDTLEINNNGDGAEIAIDVTGYFGLAALRVKVAAPGRLAVIRGPGCDTRASKIML